MMEASQHEESPYTSFADLLIGMIFIFLLLIVLLVLSVHPKVQEVLASQVKDPQQIRFLQAEVQALRDQLESTDKQQKDLSDIAIKYQKLETQFNELKSAYAAIEKQKHSLASNVSELTKQLELRHSDLETQRRSAQNETDILRTRLASAERELKDKSELVEKHKNLQLQFQKLTIAFNNAQAQLQILNSNVEDITKQLTTTKAALTDKKTSISFNEQRTMTQQRLKEFLNGMAQKLRSFGIIVSVDPENGVLRIANSILFDSSSAELSADGEQAVGILASELRTNLPCYVGNLPPVRGTKCTDQQLRIATVLIEGHADQQPVDPLRFRYRDNFELSAARAVSVYGSLLQYFPEFSDARSGSISRGHGLDHLFGVAGYGDRRPLPGVTNGLDPALRRIELRFVPEIP